MLTKLTSSPELAAQFIRRGGVVAFPTETVYGLGADLFNEAAIQQIFTAKGRPSDNPLIAHIAALADIGRLVQEITPAAEQLIAAFFPGPLTVILPKQPQVPLLATANLPTIGVRMPRHPIAQALLQACGVPVVAPSANLSGRPSPTTWQSVEADLAGRIDCILQGDQTEVGLESTVVDCSGAHPVVLRAGAITLEQLRQVLPTIALSTPDDPSLVKSPGTKYRHYSPRAKVVLVEHPPAGAATAAYIGLTAPAPAAQFRLLKLCATVEDYAHALFLFFRECDQAGVAVIYCERIAPQGLGLALLDRLQRAAQ